MITTIFAIVFLAAPVYSPENIVSVIVGGIITWAGTSWLKSDKLQGTAALFLAIVVSVIVAIAAVVASDYFNGEAFSITSLAHSVAQIFALATIAYNLLEAN